MSVNDRGTMKWTSIMLPEHVNALEKLWEEVNRKEKPILDEQQISENEFKLRAALKGKVEVRIEYFMDYNFHIVEGLIRNINNKIITIEETEIKFEDIIEADIVHSIYDPY